MATPTVLKTSFKGDTEKLDNFINHYIENGGDARKAWVDAGWSANNTSSAMARIRQHWDVVERRIVEKIGSHVPAALETVYDLMVNGKSDTVRLKAAQDLLGRAGYDQASRIEFSEKNTEAMDDKEIKTELSELLKRGGFKIGGGSGD